MYYLQSRYYDPDTGRFINADDIVMIGAGCSTISYNLFAYCENNAPNMHDIGGYAAINVICAAIGAIAGWVFGDYVAKKLGYRSGWKYWAIRAGIVIGGAVIGWFAGTLITRVVASYLIKNPAIILKIAARIGPKATIKGLKLLGINPISLMGKSMLMGFITEIFNSNPKVIMPSAWIEPLLKKAQELKLTIRLDLGHAGTAWDFPHLHIGKAHIAFALSMLEYIKHFLGL